MLRHGTRRTTASRLGLAQRSYPFYLLPRYQRFSSFETPAAVTPTSDIAVLGGGITGLASAYFLSRELPHRQITVYESSGRLGGWLSSLRVPVKGGSVLFEAGPRSLRPSGNGALAATLLQELDLANDAIFPQRMSPAARNRYIYYPDHLVRLPHPSFGLAENAWSLMTEPVFQTAIWSGITENFRPARDPSVKDESIGSFVSRRFSKTLVDRILSAVLHGIYAGDAWQLSTRSLFPTMWRDEATAGSILAGALRSRVDGVEITKREADYLQAMKDFEWDPLLKAILKDTTVFTLKDGLGALTDKLVQTLVKAGNVEFKTSTPVQSIAMSADQTAVDVTLQNSQSAVSYSQVISALAPGHLNSLHIAQGHRLIPHISTVTVMTINLFFRTPGLNPPGFGYLIPQATPFENNPERALGVVFDNALSPAPEDLDMSNWHINSVERLQEAREKGQLINVNDFAWYNIPNRPNSQDNLQASGTKLTVMLGGHWWDGWPEYPDEKQGLELARSVLKRHLNIKEEPEAWRVNLQRDCIPQYTVGHEQRLMTAHNNLWTEYKGKVRVAGNWMSGVGVNDALRSAWDVVRNLKQGRSGTGLEHIGNAEYVRLKPVSSAEADKSD